MKVKVKLLSCVQLFATPWTVAYQASPSMGFSRQDYWSGLPFPSPGDLPDPGIEPGSPALEADALTSELSGKHIYACICIYMFLRSTPWNMSVFIRSAENEDQEYRNSQVTVKAWSETHQVGGWDCRVFLLLRVPGDWVLEQVPACWVVSDSLQPMDCSSPSSSVQWISQARILEGVAISF